MPTKQETFDKSARHLLTQRKPAMGENGQCYMKTPEGDLMCAAGCLEPDMFQPGDIMGFAELEDRGHDPGLTGLLRKVHDRAPVEEWPQELRDVARTFYLSAAVVDELTANGWEPLG
jgi:hypothetical protein